MVFSHHGCQVHSHFLMLFFVAEGGFGSKLANFKLLEVHNNILNSYDMPRDYNPYLDILKIS